MSDIIPGCMKTPDWSVSTLGRECTTVYSEILLIYLNQSSETCLIYYTWLHGDTRLECLTLDRECEFVQGFYSFTYYAFH
jgi:hypothetical protein